MNATTTPLTEIESTGDLVRAAQAGDRAAFGDLFERFQPTIFAIAKRRLRSTADAQELTQDVFVQAIQKIDQLRTPECFIGWLRQITVRMAINKSLRKRPTFSIQPEVLEATLCAAASPVDAALKGEQKDQLQAGLSRLGTMDRDTLVAFYVQGQSLNQMSDQFEAPLGTIKRRLHVARKRLAKAVDQLAIA
jgi:RNA polymerase sigma-70 factor (ECF subfamily)